MQQLCLWYLFTYVDLAGMSKERLSIFIILAVSQIFFSPSLSADFDSSSEVINTYCTLPNQILRLGNEQYLKQGPIVVVISIANLSWQLQKLCYASRSYCSYSQLKNATILPYLKHIRNFWIPVYNLYCYTHLVKDSIQVVIGCCRNYTCRVHITGTQGNNKLRDLLRDQLTSCSHVAVKLYSYNVLLSYHDWYDVQC